MNEVSFARVAMTLLMLGLTTIAAMTPGQSETPPQNPDDVSLVIATNDTTYRVGDPIRIQVGLKNNGSTGIGFIAGSPWYIAHLVIQDSKGKTIPPAHDRNGATYLTTHGIFIAPGEVHTLQWQGVTWYDLSNWGYDLRQPGEYSIRGIPDIVGSYKSDTSTIRSNFARITITK